MIILDGRNGPLPLLEGRNKWCPSPLIIKYFSVSNKV
jgi:hypothetical protein